MERPYFSDWSREEIIEHLHYVLGVRFTIGRQIQILEAHLFGKTK